MAFPTQTIVGKDKLNPLIDEGLLKILRDIIAFGSSRILYQFPSMEWWIHKTSHVKALTSDFFICNGGMPSIASSSFRSVEA